MERLLPRIWVFVLAFGLGINISAIWRIYTLPDDSLPAPPEPVIEAIDQSNRAVMEMPDANTSGEEPRIIGESHGCGAAGEAGQGYDYTDGGWVWTKCRRFKSSAAAARELKNRLRSATIAEQSPDVDVDGRPAGEQYLITSPGVVRLRINGRLLCELEASSLKHLRLFEKRP